MSASLPYPGGIPYQTYTVRKAGLHWMVLSEIAICVIPALAAMGFGHLLAGGRYLAGSLFVILAYHFVKGDRFGYMAIVVGALPALTFLREIFFYYSVIFFFGSGLLLWAYTGWKEVRFVFGDITWKSLVLLSLVYWWLSILYMGDFTANIRLLDYLLSSTTIYLLVNKRSWLATGLVGFAISASALAISLLPYGDRLGAADIDGMHVGNPILMGVPSAMVLLLTLADNGRWLLLEDNPWGRAILGLLAAEWLVLSGSRGSWAITTICVVLLLIFGKLGRKAVVGFMALLCLVTAFVLLSNRGVKIQSIFQKTVDSDRSLKTRTSFRSVQWEAMPHVFAESPVWGWGPGSGKSVAYMYTGRHLAWHALYLQVIGETGILGLMLLLLILGSLLRRGIGHLRRQGEIMPLLGIVAYMTLGMSVSGFDSFSGMLLGFVFLAREPLPRMTSFEADDVPPEPDVPSESDVAELSA